MTSKVVMFVGVLTEYQGIDLLLEAVPLVVQKGRARQVRHRRISERAALSREGALPANRKVDPFYRKNLLRGCAPISLDRRRGGVTENLDDRSQSEAVQLHGDGFADGRLRHSDQPRNIGPRRRLRKDG